MVKLAYIVECACCVAGALILGVIAAMAVVTKHILDKQHD
jgi:hypothetical protein